MERMGLPLSSTKDVSRTIPLCLLIDNECQAAGFGETFGSIFAMPGIAEKGYVDVQVEVATAGGHSSIPPDHTVYSLRDKVATSVTYILIVNWRPLCDVSSLGTTSLQTSFCKGRASALHFTNT